MSLNLRTRTFYLIYCLLSAPLFALSDWLPLILCKELGASPLQLAITFAAKPTAALISFYLSSWCSQRGISLRRQIVWIGLFGAAPALFYWAVPWSWVLVVGFVCFAVALRALIPPWMEIFKQNVTPEGRSQLFARGALVTYSMGVLLPLGVGYWMDFQPGIWKGIFCVAAVLAMGAALCQRWLPKETRQISAVNGGFWLQPWKECWRLLRQRRDFAIYQGIFIFGGLGLMMMQPAIPCFLTEVLAISWTQIALVISICKAIGFVVMNRFWPRWIHRLDLFTLSALVALLAAIFPVLLLGGQWQLLMAGVAFLLYGGMKAGSDLAWHMSGPLFAKGESSVTYSSVNIVLVGLRGCIGPFLGAWLLAGGGPVLALLIGGLCCLIGAGYGLAMRRHGLTTDTALS